MEDENMKKETIILLSILVLVVVFVSGCSSQKSSSDLEKEYDQKIENTKEIAKDGFILTSKVFVPKGTFLGKVGGEFGEQIHKFYVARDKSRLDMIYSTYEIRLYTLLQNNMIITMACNNKEQKWKCEQISSMKKPNFDEKALKKLDLDILKGLKKLEDKSIIGLNAKCFEIIKDAMMCYHPEYLIQLYEKRAKGYTAEATGLEFNAPDDSVFELPKLQNSKMESSNQQVEGKIGDIPALPEE